MTTHHETPIDQSISLMANEQLDNAIVVMMYISCKSKDYDALYHEFLLERMRRDAAYP